MFIATADPTTLAPIMWGPIVYKHSVPTGLRTLSSKLFCYTDKSNTLTEHHCSPPTKLGKYRVTPAAASA